ncbi:MAG: exo-alpha-sialidase, partial [Planctomycetes bacterium]|nr:exo-alpha-sialidase [Planctomycetota bacterium]
MRFGFLTLAAFLFAPLSAIDAAEPPIMLLQGDAVRDPGEAGGARSSFAIMRLPDGSFAFYDRNHPQAGPLTLSDRDGRKHTLLPYLPPAVLNSEAIVRSGALSNTQVILTKDNHVHSVYVKGEAIDKETAARVGLPRYLDVWTTRATPSQAFEPKMIWRGYNGSQMEYQQLPSGRIIVPYGSFQPHAKAAPPTGRHATIIQYSDDDGQT